MVRLPQSAPFLLCLMPPKSIHWTGGVCGIKTFLSAVAALARLGRDVILRRGHRTQKKAVSTGARHQYLACLAGMFGLASLEFRGTPGAWRWRHLSGMPHTPF